MNEIKLQAFLKKWTMPDREEALDQWQKELNEIFW
jgi:hypothetical protein